jgi:hypothetical protein
MLIPVSARVLRLASNHLRIKLSCGAVRGRSLRYRKSGYKLAQKANGVESMIKLYDFKSSPNCQRVKVALEEKNLPYEIVAVDLNRSIRNFSN